MPPRLIETCPPIAASAETQCRSGYTPTATVSGNYEPSVGLKSDLQPDRLARAKRRAARLDRDRLRSAMRTCISGVADRPTSLAKDPLTPRAIKPQLPAAAHAESCLVTRR